MLDYYSFDYLITPYLLVWALCLLTLLRYYRSNFFFPMVTHAKFMKVPTLTLSFLCCDVNADKVHSLLGTLSSTTRSETKSWPSDMPTLKSINIQTCLSQHKCFYSLGFKISIRIYWDAKFRADGISTVLLSAMDHHYYYATMYYFVQSISLMCTGCL